jgi:hypothetical protein
MKKSKDARHEVRIYSLEDQEEIMLSISGHFLKF